MKNFIYFIIFIFSQTSYAGDLWVIKTQKKVGNNFTDSSRALQKILDKGQNEEEICVTSHILSSIVEDMRKTCEDANFVSKNEINTVCEGNQKTNYKFTQINSNYYKGNFVAKVDDFVVKGSIELKNSGKPCISNQDD